MVKRNPRVTQQDVFKAAQVIASEGKEPTLSEVRTYLGDHGSQTTLHKYLKQWKQACFERGTLEAMSDEDKIDIKALLQEKQMLEDTIVKQVKQQEDLTTELIKVERKIAALSEHLKETLLVYEPLQERYEAKIAEYQALELAYQAVKETQESAMRTLLEDKNQQIESLRNELKELNQVSLAEVRELGYQGDEALMEEKVKSLNLQEKVFALEKTVDSLQQQLNRERQTNEPLRHEIEKQKKLIEQVATFEQLRELEARRFPAEKENT